MENETIQQNHPMQTEQNRQTVQSVQVRQPIPSMPCMQCNQFGICSQYLQCSRNVTGMKERENEKSKDYALISFVLGFVSIVTWIVPLLGFASTITGIVMGVLGRKTQNKNKALVGIIMNCVFLLMTLVAIAASLYFTFNFYAEMMTSIMNDMNDINHIY